jgi:hypothetical protein
MVGNAGYQVRGLKDLLFQIFHPWLGFRDSFHSANERLVLHEMGARDLSFV